VELSKKSKDCEDLMIKIENDTINANESQKEVEKRTAVLDKEKAEIETLAREAQAEVDKAEPILKAADEGLNNLQKNKIAELRTYNQPPPAVNVVCSAIMTILGKDTSWASIKKEINDPDFLKKLKTYDKENMS
jgi:dynein heavy chain